ncbi:MAG: LytTR family transcriptional regulator [Bacteroidales bacterium]|nr:LytTR family transcriptional regulator [Bacteroidales bacterium]
MKHKFRTHNPLSALAIALLYTLFVAFVEFAYSPEYNLSFTQVRMMREMSLSVMLCILAVVFVVAFVSRLLHSRVAGGTGWLVYLLWQAVEYAVTVAATAAVMVAANGGAWCTVALQALLPALLTLLPVYLAVMCLSACKYNREAVAVETEVAPSVPEVPASEPLPEPPAEPVAEQLAEVVATEQGEIGETLSAAGDTVSFVDEKGVVKLSVAPQDVYYIESAGNYVTVAYRGGERLMRQGMRGSLKAMTPMAEQCGLLRCHRSYFINPAQVASIQRDGDNAYAQLTHEGANPIPITKSYLQAILDAVNVK